MMTGKCFEFKSLFYVYCENLKCFERQTKTPHLCLQLRFISSQVKHSASYEKLPLKNYFSSSRTGRVRLMSTALFLGKSSLEALLGYLPKLNKFFGNMMWGKYFGQIMIMMHNM